MINQKFVNSLPSKQPNNRVPFSGLGPPGLYGGMIKKHNPKVSRKLVKYLKLTKKVKVLNKNIRNRNKTNKNIRNRNRSIRNKSKKNNKSRK